VWNAEEVAVLSVNAEAESETDDVTTDSVAVIVTDDETDV
jgi:hypothetical protein